MSNYMPAGANDEQHETGPIDIPPADWLREQVNQNRILEGLDPEVLSKADGPKGINLSSGGLYVSLPDRLAVRIEELSNLQPNWDSYGGTPPTQSAIQAASLLISSPCQLTPCSDGGVQIDWACGAEITFRPDGSQEFDAVSQAAFEGLVERHQTILGHDIAAERERQDKQWGGPAHDDGHDLTDWGRFIKRFVRLAEDAVSSSIGEREHIEYEKRMIQIAALAVAAIQSSRRQRGA